MSYEIRFVFYLPGGGRLIERRNCRLCDGTGKNPAGTRSDGGPIPGVNVCRLCDGNGKEIDERGRDACESYAAGEAPESYGPADAVAIYWRGSNGVLEWLRDYPNLEAAQIGYNQRRAVNQPRPKGASI